MKTRTFSVEVPEPGSFVTWCGRLWQITTTVATWTKGEHLLVVRLMPMLDESTEMPYVETEPDTHVKTVNWDELDGYGN